MIVGILSDTHGTLSKKTINALSGVSHIIHAGDVGSQDILSELNKIAPLTAVRGNTDTQDWAEVLPGTDIVSLGGLHLFVLHNLDYLDLDPGAAGFNVVIYGHTHQPEIKTNDDVLYLNPGSASYRRYGGPLSIAMLSINDGNLDPEIVVIEQ